MLYHGVCNTYVYTCGLVSYHDRSVLYLKFATGSLQGKWRWLRRPFHGGTGWFLMNQCVYPDSVTNRVIKYTEVVIEITIAKRIPTLIRQLEICAYNI